MKPVSKELKSWVELIEKFLLVAVLSAGVIASGYKGFEFLSKKTELQTAKNEAFKAVVQSHEGLVRSLDAQISGLDAELSNLPTSDKLWKSKEMVRKLKASDRRIVMYHFTENLLSLGKEAPVGNEKP